MTKGSKKPAALFEAVIDGELFARTAIACSTEVSRYYLTGVNVEPVTEGGALLVASNGSILVGIRDASALVKGNAIVSLGRPLLRALSAKPKCPRGIGLLTSRLLVIRGYADHTARAFVVDQPAVHDAKGLAVGALTRAAALTALDDPDVRVVAAQFHGAIVYGIFPDWRRVLVPSTKQPDPLAPESYGVDGRLFSALADALHSNVDPKSRGLRVEIGGAHDPIIVKPIDDFIDGFGVIMPLRVPNPSPASIPKWARKT